MDESYNRKLDVHIAEDFSDALDAAVAKAGLTFAEYAQLFPEAAYDVISITVLENAERIPRVDLSGSKNLSATSEMDGPQATAGMVRSSLAFFGLKASEVTRPVEVVVSVYRSDVFLKVIHFIVPPPNSTF